MSLVTLSISEISSLLLWCSSLSIIKVVVSFTLWIIFPFFPLDIVCSEMVLPASAVNLKSMTIEVILWNKWQCERYDVDHKNAHVVVRVQMSQILVNVKEGVNKVIWYHYGGFFGLIGMCKNSSRSVANMRSCCIFQIKKLVSTKRPEYLKFCYSSLIDGLNCIFGSVDVWILMCLMKKLQSQGRLSIINNKRVVMVIKLAMASEFSSVCSLCHPYLLIKF